MIKVVHIVWTDAASHDSWHTKSELSEKLERPPEECESIGMLIHRKNKDKVTILQTFSPNQVLGVFEIPRGCIKSIKTICTLPLTIEI
jgi:hypothetical protein